MKPNIMIDYINRKNSYSYQRGEYLIFSFDFPYFAIKFFNELIKFIPRKYIYFNLLSQVLSLYGDRCKFLKKIPDSLTIYPSEFPVDRTTIVISIKEDYTKFVTNEITIRSLMRKIPGNYFKDKYNLINNTKIKDSRNLVKILKYLGL